MRFFVINTDYPQFINHLLREYPTFASESYAEQWRIRRESLFGTADFYSSNLRKLGHEAWDVIANIEPMQKQWAKEHGINLTTTTWDVRLRRGAIPWPYRRINDEWLYSVLAAQVRTFRPDVIYSMAMETIDSTFLRSVKGYYRVAIGQHAATPLKTDVSAYDLVLTSLPSQVDFFRKSGHRSELFRLGFEPRVLEQLKAGPNRYQVVFAGGLGTIYQDGTHTLEQLAQHLPVDIWGYGLDNLIEISPIRQHYHGTIWGSDMYQTLHDSMIVFNRHSNLADRYYANNMRLFEATGVGTLLLTDAKCNLSELFEPGREIVAYRNFEECLELAQYYLDHDNERESIAAAGQQRTLHEHTWYHRMQELTDIVYRFL